MIVNEVATTSGNKERFDRIISSGADTALLKKAFGENLQQSGLNFSTSWVSDSGKKVLAKKTSGFYFESHLFPYSFGVHIASYNSYLFRKITPQLIFVLVLLSLTGAAFLIAYRNLKNQVRLGMLKDDFISNISHELKTPVSTVKVAIEALQNFVHDDSKEETRNTAETTKEYLHIASQEMDRLELLIGKVLNSSLLDNGVQVMNFEKINVVLLIEEVLQSLRLRFATEKAVVNFDRPPAALYADADKLHLQGVLINLLDNCLKYADKELNIAICLLDQGPNISITVADNGPGIPDEFLDKVFEKFFRIPTGNRHKVKGYGLGLSYAKQVMQQHSGTIAVKNVSTGGCMFTLTFPKAEA
jgi:two-component system phosphate regulon sensor histidine kinase PhoR